MNLTKLFLKKRFKKELRETYNVILSISLKNHTLKNHLESNFQKLKENTLRKNLEEHTKTD